MNELGDTQPPIDVHSAEDDFREYCAERGSVARYFLIIGLIGFVVFVDIGGVLEGLWRSRYPIITRPILAAIVSFSLVLVGFGPESEMWKRFRNSGAILALNVAWATAYITWIATVDVNLGYGAFSLCVVMFSLGCRAGTVVAIAVIIPSSAIVLYFTIASGAVSATSNRVVGLVVLVLVVVVLGAVFERMSRRVFELRKALQRSTRTLSRAQADLEDIGFRQGSGGADADLTFMVNANAVVVNAPVVGSVSGLIPSSTMVGMPLAMLWPRVGDSLVKLVESALSGDADRTLSVKLFESFGVFNLHFRFVRVTDTRVLVFVDEYENASDRDDKDGYFLKQSIQRQRYEVVGKMMLGLANNFNNVFAVIRENVGLLTPACKDDSISLANLEVIDRSVIRAGNMANELADFAGFSGQEKTVVDVPEIVNSMETLLLASIPGHARLFLEVEGKVARILGSAGELRQAILNLVLNAGEAIGIEQGIIRICIFMEYGEKTSDTKLVVDVTDDGEGMTALALGKVFQPFYSTKQESRGMGLATVQGIVHSQGGDIDIHSAAGEGTVVRLRYTAISEELK